MVLGPWPVRKGLLIWSVNLTNKCKVVKEISKNDPARRLKERKFTREREESYSDEEGRNIVCKDTVVGESLGIRRNCKKASMPKTQGTRDGDKANVQSGGKPI